MVEVTRTPEKGREEKFPVVAPSLFDDTQIPYRAEKAPNLIEMRLPFPVYLGRMVLFKEGVDPLVILLRRVDIGDDVFVPFHQRFHLHFGNKVDGTVRVTTVEGGTLYEPVLLLETLV